MLMGYNTKKLTHVKNLLIMKKCRSRCLITVERHEEEKDVRNWSGWRPVSMSGHVTFPGKLDHAGPSTYSAQFPGSHCTLQNVFR